MSEVAALLDQNKVEQAYAVFRKAETISTSIAPTKPQPGLWQSA